jgi:hypothetical protein
MPSAVSLMHPAIRVKWLAVQVRCEGKSRIDATIRERSGGRSLALPVACKLAQSRIAVISALQAVGIIVGIIWLSRCRRCRECHAHKRRGSNELEHFIFLPLTAIHGALPLGVSFSSAPACHDWRHIKSRSRGWSQGRVLAHSAARHTRTRGETFCSIPACRSAATARL